MTEAEAAEFRLESSGLLSSFLTILDLAMVGNSHQEGCLWFCAHSYLRKKSCHRIEVRDEAATCSYHGSIVTLW